MDILIKVIGQRLKVPCASRNIVSGSKRFIRIKFALEEDWDNLIAHAKFFQGNDTYDAVLNEENSCYVPSELSSGSFSVMLYGIGGSGGAVVATTDSVDFEMEAPLYTPTGEEGEESDYDEDFIATTDEVLQYLNSQDPIEDFDSIASISEVLSYLGIQTS